MQTSALMPAPHATRLSWDVPQLYPAWAARAPTIFAGPLFQMALQRAFAAKALPALAAFRGDDLTGLLPLCRLPAVRGMLSLRETGFARNAHTLRNHLLTDDPQVILAMLRVWHDDVDADTLLLENLPADDALMAAIADAASALNLRSDAPTPARRLDYAATDMPYDDYLATRSGQFRRQIRKRLRELQQAGTFHIEPLTGNALLAALPDWRAVVDQSWQGSAAANTPADWALHTALAHNGTLWLARLDARPVAALRMLEDTRAVYVHTMHFDQSLRDHAPGLVLFDAMMQDACTRRLPRVDFNGTSAFFARWATGQTRQMSIRIYRRNLRGRGAQTMRALLHRLRRPSDAAPETLPAPPE
jgi:Acetyltransferase (GNAT) domain